ARRMDRIAAGIESEFPNLLQIGARELAEKLAGTPDKRPALYDVRTVAEFEVSHLPGAKRVSPNVRIRHLIPQLDPSRTSVFYCTVGYRSSSVVHFLREAGFTNAAVLRGS